jgi:hypothetical protein
MDFDEKTGMSVIASSATLNENLPFSDGARSQTHAVLNRRAEVEARRAKPSCIDFEGRRTERTTGAGHSRTVMSSTRGMRDRGAAPICGPMQFVRSSAVRSVRGLRRTM